MAILAGVTGEVSADSLAGDQADRASLPGPSHVVAQPLPQSSALDVASRGHHTCAVTSSGGVRCWGNNDFGQLGDGVASRYPLPVGVLGFEGQGDTSLLLSMIYH